MFDRTFVSSLSVAALLLAFAPATAQAQRRGAARTAEPATVALPDAWLEDLGWRSIGPANMGGRIVSIAAHPTDRATYWLGSASGGVLKTTNAGRTYEHQFDQEETVSIGHLAVSTSNPDVLWVGTGEANPRNSVSYGNGVYKSTDGGATWTHMGLEHSFQIGRIAIHPTDENTVYVGALGRLYGESEERGLYKTTDGGTTWERVLYVDERTGVTDIDMHPTDPNTLLVATYERQRDEFDTNQPAKKWGPGSGIWRTTDGGATWTELTEGLPTVDKGRIGIDWYRADPNIVFALVETERISRLPDDVAYMGMTGEDADTGARLTNVTEGGPSEAAELRVGDIVTRADGERVLAYDDLVRVIRQHKAGETIDIEYVRERQLFNTSVEFGPVPPPENEPDLSDEDALHARDLSLGLGGQRAQVQDAQGYDALETGGTFKSTDGGVTWTRINSLNPRPMYYSQIRVDPSDANHVYVLGTRLHRSSDGGVTFTSDGADGEVHVDHHALWIDPDDGRHMILGNDGGIYITRDRMESWDHHNHVAIGQFYRVTTDSEGLYSVYGGLQDNGSWGAPNRTRNSTGVVNSDWLSIGGGDGFVCKVDPNDPDQIYYESQNGGMRWRNLRTGEFGSMRPRAPEGVNYRFNWNTPFVLSSFNGKIVYAAGNHVFRSLDRGNGMKAISPELTRTERGSATTLAESPRDSDRLYVGTDDGALWTTRDGGTTWIDLMAPAAAVAPEVTSEGDATEATESDSTDSAEANDAPTLAGRWAARVTRMRAADEGLLELSLAEDADGALVGGFGTQSSSVESARYEASDGSIAITHRLGDATIEQTGVIDGERMTGWLSTWDGALQVFYRAEREENLESGGATGRWRLSLLGEVVAPEAGRFAIGLTEETADAAPDAAVTESEEPTTADAGVTLSGSIAAGSWRTDVQNAVWDSEADVLSLTFERDGARSDLVATLADDQLSGSFTAAGLFDVRFVARPDDDSGESRSDGERESGARLVELLPKPMWVSAVVPSAFVTERVYVTFDGHRSDLDDPFVFVSEDGGETWRDISANLPRGSTRTIAEDRVNRDLLYLGTEFGAYMSLDRGRSWMEMGADLPTVAVHEFAQAPNGGDVVAATHGRSLWILDATVLRQMTPEALAARATLFEPSEGVFWRGEVTRGSSGTRRFRGENPPSGVTLFYSLNGNARDVNLRITDLGGTLIQELEASTDAGLHRATWNLRGPGRMTSRGFMRSGAPVEPGRYLATLEANGDTQTREIRVVPDPDGAEGPTMAQLEYMEDLEEFEGEREEGGDDDEDLSDVVH
ncbi:BNR/Asp-box repeat protein [Planctomycetes bacterium Pla163]|uniref:BNR/Asp-box repeat protein n=1 Tax=Rohdeia mirabilis TaxID=2528008 RepID=A0A518D3D5_9BACT|nr:BNR/Asp-box repeat protein [Planctomycetes bacterium Pla163]